MRKIILIYGLPGVGKTSVVEGFVQGFERFTKPFVHYIKYNLCIVGDYDADTPFKGTDKLSMSIQPTVVEFIKNNEYQYIIEGDRLFNGKFIEAVKPTILFIEASHEQILERRLKRGIVQDPTFLKAKQTKINNIKAAYDHYVITNNNEMDLPKIRQEIALLMSNRSNLPLIKADCPALF